MKLFMLSVLSDNVMVSDNMLSDNMFSDNMLSYFYIFFLALDDHETVHVICVF
jgi:hypothetical protein